jgi:thiol:disulfide interchange protein DsbD
LLARFGIENAEADHEEGWVVDDIEGAFAMAIERNVPVMVDFSGYTCTNCRDMEATIFPRTDVKARLDSAFVPLRLYTDDLQTGDAFHAFQMELTGTPALPTYAIVLPADSTVIAQQSAMMSEHDFIAFLDQGSYDFQSGQ